MTITPQDAAEALKLVDVSERRSVALRGYQKMAPHLMLWGVIWAIGNAVDYFAPAHARLVWRCLTIVGWTGGYLMTARDRQQAPDQKFFGILLTVTAFLVASIIIMSPHKPNQVRAFISLLVAACYTIVGLFGMPRLVAAGVVLFVAILLGYFVFPGIFPLWMAVVGGGSLFLSGVWLWRI